MLVYQRVGFFFFAPFGWERPRDWYPVLLTCPVWACTGICQLQSKHRWQTAGFAGFLFQTYPSICTYVFFFLIPCFFQQLLLTLICPDAFSAVEKRQPAFGWGLPQVKLGHPFWPQSKWVAQPYVWDLASQLLTCGCRHQERNSFYFQDHPNSCLLRCTVWCSFPFCTKFSEMQTHFPAWLSLTVSLLIS